MSRKNWVIFVLMLACGIGIFAYSLRDIKLSSIIMDLVHLNWGWFGTALLCICLYLFLEAVVVKIFMNDRHDGFTWKDAIRIPLVEQLGNGLTPFSTGGQPAQLLAMMQAGVDAGQASSVLLMKFVVFQSMIVINFIISLLVGFHYIAAKMHVLSLLVLFGFLVHLSVIIGLLLVMYWYNFTKKAANIVIRPAHWFMKPDKYEKMQATLNEKIDTFYLESLKIKSEYGKMAKVSLITLLQLGFYYLIPYFIMLSLGIDGLNVLMVVSLNVLIFMVISLFPIPGGTGGAEYSFSVLFSSFIASGSKLVLAMLLWRILTYYFGMFAGMFALMIKPDRVHEPD